MLRGVCYSWCVANGDFDLEERMLAMLKLFLVGISKK